MTKATPPPSASSVEELERRYAQLSAVVDIGELSAEGRLARDAIALAKHEARIAELEERIENPRPRVCCGDYAACQRPCTPRGRWQVENGVPEPRYMR